MRVLVVDDHPVVIQGCRLLLEPTGACETKAASSLTQAFRIYRQWQPELIILDLSMQPRTLGGLGFLRRLRRVDPDIHVIVFSMHTDPGIVRRALSLGASGYILKDTTPEEFVVAFDKITQGKAYVSEALAMDIAFDHNATGPLSDLSPRELDVLNLIAAGHQYAAIGQELNISYKSVVHTVAALKRIFGVQTLRALTQVALNELPMARSSRW